MLRNRVTNDTEIAMNIENKLVAKEISNESHPLTIRGATGVQPLFNGPSGNSNIMVTNKFNESINGLESVNNHSYVGLPSHLLSQKNRSRVPSRDILRSGKTVKLEDCYNYRMQLSITIQELIKNSGKTKAQLAKEIGVDESAIRKWIDTGSIKNTNLAKLAEACGYIAMILLRDGEEYVNFVSKDSKFVPLQLTQPVAELASLIEGLDASQKNFLTMTTLAIRHIDPNMLTAVEKMLTSLAQSSDVKNKLSA